MTNVNAFSSLNSQEPCHLTLNKSAAPIDLYDADQIKQIEQAWFDQSFDRFGLMQQAAWQMAQQIIKGYRPKLSARPKSPRALIWVGEGNNGGDGWLIAHYLQQAGWQIHVILVTESHHKKLTKNETDENSAYRARDLAISANCPYKCFKEIADIYQDQHQHHLLNADVYIDAIFGIGLSRAPTGVFKDAIKLFNQAAMESHAWVIAADIPSGLMASTGQVFDGTAVKAEVTLCLIARKLGLHTKDGLDYCGNIIDLPLIPQALPPKALRLSQPSAIPRRQQNSHKGSFGHVIIIGGNQVDGSQGMGGAAILASASALAMGAGKLTAACHKAFHSALLTVLPDAMTVDLHDEQGVCQLIKAADVIAIGMGLGRDEPAKKLFINYVQAAINHDKPLIIDADGLYHLAALNLDQHFLIDQLKAFSQKQSLYLTPHSGEAATLLNSSADNVEADRVSAIYACQNHFGGAWVLKGAGSLILQDQLFVCGTGNSGMASAGMGDVLSGVIAGLLAQKDLAELPNPLTQAVLIHGLAGDILVNGNSKSHHFEQNGIVIGQRGLQAQDMPAAIRHVVEAFTI